MRIASMRRLAAVAVCTLVLFSAASRAEEPTTQRTDPKLPDVPGPFHAYNVTNNYNKDYKHRYHSPISQFGLEPMVMLFTRETEFSDPLKDLLKQIDNAVEKNPTARLHPFLVVQSDALPEVIGVDPDPAAASKDDDKRGELATKLEGESDALMLKHVDILLAGKADLAKFNLDNVGFAFYLFQRDKVTAGRVVKKGDKLDDALVKEIVAELAEKAHATRK